ncbi:hypothetical protein JCM10908_002104 [Rhodotorula pacifica]|uniref:uncharacterized protein n=1 Tax=Rhodotorula pacifica TaxID=1495444 RepID=UPI0031801A05
MEQLSESTTQSLGDVQLPPQLEQRLAEEQDRFHHQKSIDEDLAAASARHDAVLQDRVQHAHAEVEHAKQVAAAHHHQTSTSGGTSGLAAGAEAGAPAALGARTGSETGAVEQLSRGVQEKQRHVEQQRAELSDLEARLERAAQVERDLRARLGEAV